MTFTYVGEWIKLGVHYPVSEERMIADLAYIYKYNSEFDNWYDLYSDGVAIYMMLTRKSGVVLWEKMSVYLKNDLSVKLEPIPDF